MIPASLGIITGYRNKGYQTLNRLMKIAEGYDAAGLGHEEKL